MGRYIIRRLLWVIVLLFVVSAVTFLIFYELPSANPAVLRAGRSPNPALIAAISKSLGLNRPIYVQYWLYIKGIILHFNFGYSYQFSQPVRSMIFQRLPATISLTVGAVVIWLLIGIPIGIISAVRSRSVMDRTAMGGALLAISAPSRGEKPSPHRKPPCTRATSTRRRKDCHRRMSRRYPATRLL